MQNVVLFGPPGAGKGTQLALIIEKFHLIHLSTGDLLRSEIAAQSPLGIQAKSLMDAGILVPDAVVIGMIASRLEAHPEAQGFIFDGFPRTIAQAEALDELLAGYHSKISRMISLGVPEQELKQRLMLRGEALGRSDDNEETILRRIHEYQEKTLPVAGYYKASDKYFEISGVGTVEEIFGRISQLLETPTI